MPKDQDTIDAMEFAAEWAFSNVVEGCARTCDEAALELYRACKFSVECDVAAEARGEAVAPHMALQRNGLRMLASDPTWLRHASRAARHWEQYGNNPIARRATDEAYTRAYLLFGIVEEA